MTFVGKCEPLPRDDAEQKRDRAFNPRLDRRKLGQAVFASLAVRRGIERAKHVHNIVDIVVNERRKLGILVAPHRQAVPNLLPLLHLVTRCELHVRPCGFDLRIRRLHIKDFHQNLAFKPHLLRVSAALCVGFVESLCRATNACPAMTADEQVMW